MKTAKLLLAVCAFAAACSSASGEAVGGGLTGAGAGAATPPPFNPPASDAGDAGSEDCGEGTTWSSIYRDIFGPTGKAGSCSLLASCHGSPTSDGALSGAGLKCFDEAGCRESMIGQFLARPADKDDPEGAILFGVIRHRDAKGNISGFMPKTPRDYVFPEACLTRIKGWIANGVPAD